MRLAYRKVVKKITEYTYRLDGSYSILVYAGVDHEKGRVLIARDFTETIVNQSKDLPKPESMIYNPIEVNISWLVANLREKISFRINREKAATPRRNSEVVRTEFLSCVLCLL